MDSKKSLKDELESALVALNEKIDSLKAKVDQLCQNTGGCDIEPEERKKTPKSKN
jgi:hypothetical protein|tara:strand:- start:1483 stop:1647 length:165 start_codon:yes stop_codon:yes gene_type:complete